MNPENRYLKPNEGEIQYNTQIKVHNQISKSVHNLKYIHLILRKILVYQKKSLYINIVKTTETMKFIMVQEKLNKYFYIPRGHLYFMLL